MMEYNTANRNNNLDLSHVGSQISKRWSYWAQRNSFSVKRKYIIFPGLGVDIFLQVFNC